MNPMLLVVLFSLLGILSLLVVVGVLVVAQVRSGKLADTAQTCKVCPEQAFGSCRECKGYFCRRHGGRSFAGLFCTDCYNKHRWRLLLVGIVATVIGIGLGSLALVVVSVAKEGAWEPVVVSSVSGGGALVLLAQAAFAFWGVVRRFPKKGSANRA
jgi:hypothetical protein